MDLRRAHAASQGRPGTARQILDLPMAAHNPTSLLDLKPFAGLAQEPGLASPRPRRSPRRHPCRTRRWFQELPARSPTRQPVQAATTPHEASGSKKKRVKRHAAKAILGAPCTYEYGQDMVSVYRLPRNAICAPCHKGVKAINEGTSLMTSCWENELVISTRAEKANMRPVRE
ncbi:unnamed protein product [Miscanthus lutarioriparius]|uniref:Uncharacterized protein n=1 Tax=Miscanthus lutarioriparius TaxID=422564 RepID=A0A811RDZ3_9POAL|nr:unnamed protein product [Miscanthus lutarioriparius]